MVLALALVVVAPRLLFLDADPPQDMHVHFVTDEGWWAHNARQRALFGRWILDEHNPPLFLAPVHSGVLFATYEAFGVGLRQTRLPSAVAGILTCLIVGLVVRREASDRAAFWSVLLLGTSYFLLSHNRVAFTESLQLLLVTGAMLGFLRARERPLLGAAAGLSLVAAVGVKPNAAIAGVVVGALWLGLILDRHADAAARTARSRAAWAFGAAFALGAGAVWVLLAEPHLGEIQRELARHLPRGLGDDPLVGGPLGLLLWFGHREQPAPSPDPAAGAFVTERVLSGFFQQSWPLVLAVAGAAVLRLLGARRTAVGWLEATCWLWLGLGLALLASKSYQPDRYFLLLVPPCAVIAALAWSGRAAGASDDARAAPVRGRGLRIAVAGGVIGLLLAVYGRATLMPMLLDWTAELPLGDQPGIGEGVLLTALWTAALAAGLAIAVAAWRALGGRRLALGAPLLLLAIVVHDVARFAPQLAAPRFTIRDAGRELGALLAPLPAARRVVVGDSADALSLEHDAFAFLIRDWPFKGMQMNLDGIERFHPSLGVFVEWRGVSAAGMQAVDWSAYPVVRAIDAWPDRQGRSQLRILVHAIDPRLAPAAAGGGGAP